MKDFAEAVIGKLAEGLLILAPASLLVVVTLGLWVTREGLALLGKLSDSILLVLGVSLAFVVGIILTTWSQQGCQRFYASRIDPTRLMHRFYARPLRWILRVLFHWMPRPPAGKLEAAQELRSALDAEAQVPNSRTPHRFDNEGWDDPWEKLTESRLMIGDLAQENAAAMAASSIHMQIALLLNCSLALSLIAIQLALRLALTPWLPLDLNQKQIWPTSLIYYVLPVIALACSLGARVLAGRYWVTEIQMTSTALQTALWKLRNDRKGPQGL